MRDDRERNTVALFDEDNGAHIGYLHLPTEQIATPSGNWSDPTVNARTGRPTKAHQARLNAAARWKESQ